MADLGDQLISCLNSHSERYCSMNENDREEAITVAKEIANSLWDSVDVQQILQIHIMKARRRYKRGDPLKKVFDAIHNAGASIAAAAAQLANKNYKSTLTFDEIQGIEALERVAESMKGRESGNNEKKKSDIDDDPNIDLNSIV
ncbi:hypothetical protein SNEBB_007456 [Seison nebaliae]|nr:hypothetical protein SNEBB_007456 [Seison nebaliae]